MGGDTAQETVAAVLAELDRLVPGGPAGVAVAVSGGGDSVALLLLAARWARARGRSIAVATVDHGLRPESASEAQGVADLCARLGIPHKILQAGDLRDAGGNLAAAAREARFALLGDWARAQGFAAVLLGHSMDDQAETVLMRLARGSGVEGLSAMQPAIRRAGVMWLRPLLDIRRKALRAVLMAKGVGWVEDPTNEDPEYDRVKARQALGALAPMGIDAEGLARTAWHLQRQRRVLERAMCDLASRARCFGELGEARLDLAAMVEDEPDTALRLFADTLVRVSGAIYRPRFRSLSQALDQVNSGANVTLSGCMIRSDRGVALICREPSACEPPRPLQAGATVWDRRWRVTISGRWPGTARLGALGAPGMAALRRAAESGDWTAPDAWAAAPRAVRQTTPAVWGGDSFKAPLLLAAPLAGHRAQRGIGPECTLNAQNLSVGELRSTFSTK